MSDELRDSEIKAIQELCDKSKVSDLSFWMSSETVTEAVELFITNVVKIEQFDEHFECLRLLARQFDSRFLTKVSSIWVRSDSIEIVLNNLCRVILLSDTTIRLYDGAGYRDLPV